MKIHYIKEPADLDSMLEQIKNFEEIALDLEFDRDRFAYGFTLCLLQIAGRDSCYIVDPFGLADISGIFEILEDPKILKVLHSSSEDLRLLHSLSCYPQNIYDTGIACRLMNYEFTSLAHVLSDVLGISLQKEEQSSNWLQRPLSEAKIRYAANDVLYLLLLKDAFMKEAMEKGLSELINEENQHLSRERYVLEKKQYFLKRDDELLLSPTQQYRLNELYKLRDEWGEKCNKPAYQIFSEDLLRKLALDEISLEQFWDQRQVLYLLKAHPNKRIFSQAWRLVCTQSLKQKKSLAASKKKAEKSDFYLSKEELLAEKERVFNPIKEEMGKVFGLFALPNILSEKTIQAILKKHQSISDIHNPYIRKAIIDIAHQKNIDISSYL